MRVEIWMGGMTNPAYTIQNPKKVEISDDGIARITDDEGWVFETSPNNIVLIKEPQRGDAE